MEDCQPVAVGSIPTSVRSKVWSLVVWYIPRGNLTNNLDKNDDLMMALVVILP